jgi:diguanylate cyclase (GGDEF)-like protein/PAS domain S-box-containing protein
MDTMVEQWPEEPASAEEARYRAVFDVLGEGLIVWGPDGAVASSNRAAAEILGLPLERLQALDFDELMRMAEHELRPVGPDGVVRPRSTYHGVVAAQLREPVRGQVLGIHRLDGTLVWIEVAARVLDDPRHGALMISSFRDITATKGAQDRLRFQAKLLDAVGQAVVTTDRRGTVLYWNAAAEELFGWSAEHAVGRNSRDLVVSLESTADAKSIARKINAGRTWAGYFEMQRHDGVKLTLFVTNTPVLDETGKLAALIGVSSDVTEYKAAEDHMRALSAIVEASSDAIMRESVDGIIESWNAGAEALYGYTADEMIGRHAGVLFPEDRIIELEDNLRHIADNRSIPHTVTVRRRKDGSCVDVAVTWSPVQDATGVVVGAAVIAHEVTDLVEARDAVARSEERFRSLVQHAADVALVFDAESMIVYASPAVERFGYVPEDLVGTPSRQLVHPDDAAQLRQTVIDAVVSTGSSSIEWRFRTAGGEYRWTEAVITDMRDVPAVAGFVANIRDITDRKQAEAERIEAEERFRQGFERSAFGLAILDLRYSCTSANSALSELLGCPVEDLLGRRPLELLHPAETAVAQEGAERLLLRDGPTFYKREHRMVRADGSIVWVLVDMTVVRDAHDEPSYYFVQIRDITDRKGAEEALEHQALHDDLTRLPNRLLLVDRLTHSLARAERPGNNLAVLFLDLDRFKLVNDGLGHAVGDQLLVEVAQRLQRTVRGSDTVARFGGDEFVILREDVKDAGEAVQFAERVAAILHEPIALSDRELYATASIGIAIGGEGASAEQLLRDADAAMYRAKDLGRARIELFSHELQQRVAARLDLEIALRQAIEHDELRLLYQPIVRLADGRVVGAEALLRWHREGHGVVLPGAFIPVAEETGLIVPIGTWALEHALTELRALTRDHDAADRPLLAVNLSALQLRLPASIAMVRDAIDASGVDPSMLSLEITESALMDDIDTSARAMHALRELGVRLAVDDFGTGYSSLAYLKQLPIDSLKIDRSFIAGLPSDPHDRSITEAIVTLGSSLGLTIVAEGVETVEQWIALDELGCTAGQGFLWSPPVPPASLAPLITGLRRMASVARATSEPAGGAN